MKQVQHEVAEVGLNHKKGFRIISESLFCILNVN
jgi:hypothetical protein